MKNVLLEFFQFFIFYIKLKNSLSYDIASNNLAFCLMKKIKQLLI